MVLHVIFAAKLRHVPNRTNAPSGINEQPRAAAHRLMAPCKHVQVIGDTAVELDGRFATVRSRESNLGTWVADVWRAGARADIVLLNSGTLRSDRLHPAGQLTMKVCS